MLRISPTSLLLLALLPVLIIGTQQQTLAQQQKGEETAPTADNITPTDAESLFAKTVKDDEKAWLSVDGDKLLALYLSETSGRAHGGVLIIPQAGRRPASHGLINALRHNLSDHHWHTLALDMTSQLAANGSIDQDKAQKAIRAGIAHLNKQGIYNIAVLGEGIGALHALRYVSTLQDNSDTSSIQPIRALIMINAQNVIPGTHSDPFDAFTTIKLPILDAYSGDDFQAQQRASARKKAARKQHNRQFQQIRLPRTVAFTNAYTNRTTKQIRGWLDRNVAGFMVQK